MQLFLSVEMQKERGGGAGAAGKEADARRLDLEVILIFDSLIIINKIIIIIFGSMINNIVVIINVLITINIIIIIIIIGSMVTKLYF